MAPQLKLHDVANKSMWSENHYRCVSISKEGDAYLRNISPFDIHQSGQVKAFTEDELVTLKDLFADELGKDDSCPSEYALKPRTPERVSYAYLSNSDANIPTDENVHGCAKVVPHEQNSFLSELNPRKDEKETPHKKKLLSKHNLPTSIVNYRKIKDESHQVKNMHDFSAQVGTNEVQCLSFDVANLFSRPLFKSRIEALGSKRQLVGIKEGLSNLSHGWVEVKLRRTGGARKGRIDTLFYSESGLRFKSMVQIDNFLEAMKITGGMRKLRSGTGIHCKVSKEKISS